MGSALEHLLVEKSGITETQLRRARRIATRLRRPTSVGEVLIELGLVTRAEYDRIVRLHRASLGITEILREDGALDEAGVAAYERLKTENPGKTDRELLVGQDLVSEEQFLRAISTKDDVPYVEPEVALIDRGLVARASVPYLTRNRVLPFRMVDGALHAIMADPHDTDVVHELERMFEARVKPCCAPANRIMAALANLQKVRGLEGGVHSSGIQYREIKDEPAEEGADEGAVRIVDYLLSKAIELGASDLHIEPLASRIRVRIRVDGVLRQLTEMPSDLAARIISRVKILAGVDIAERRAHQDGRIFVKFESREVDFRVSTYASMFGETLVLRLLDRERGMIPLESQGFEPNVLTLLREIVLRTSSGLVLVTGPTGSGKTSTLYSFVDYVNDGSMKVISCEDPVEYVLEGVTQCWVNEKHGPTFADSLRAMLRQDPDVIVVGEVRDTRTAGLAVEAALTGHKVLSTFHTEDSVGAVTRLLEMGVEPFLVASTLACVVAQRLVRRLCEECRRPVEPSPQNLRYLGIRREDLRGAAVLEGAGCDACGHEGYRGRMGIHEVLLPDDDFRDAIMQRAPSRELRALARQLPRFLSLQEDGLLKITAGRTTLAEIARQIPRDPDARPLTVLKQATASRRR